MDNIIYILIMGGVTFLIRVLPMTLIKKPIKNKFVKSLLYYIPYVTIALMTFPAIVAAAQTPLAGICAFIVGIILAWLGLGLLPVAFTCSLIALLIGFI